MSKNPETLPESGTEFVLGPSGGWREKVKNWFKNNSSIILAIGVILVLGGSIYAYNQSRSQPIFKPADESAEQTINLEEQEQLSKTENNNIQEKEENKDENENETQPNSQDKDQQELDVTQNQQGEKIVDRGSQKTFQETAKQGEGITHLARRALKKYLKETGGDPQLSKEHKVYIEDYLQNKAGQEQLTTGETREFSQDLIEKAVHESKQLNDQQLAKITPFAQQANL